MLRWRRGPRGKRQPSALLARDRNSGAHRVQELPEAAEVWKAASADMLNVPVVPVLGWFESAPVEEWRKDVDPMDSVDSFWLVCKFEGTFPEPVATKTLYVTAGCLSLSTRKCCQLCDSTVPLCQEFPAFSLPHQTRKHFQRASMVHPLHVPLWLCGINQALGVLQQVPQRAYHHMPSTARLCEFPRLEHRCEHDSMASTLIH